MGLNLLLPFLLAAFSNPASAASLDVTTDYRLRALSYTNLNLEGPNYNRSFMTQNARLGVVIKDVWRSSSGNDERIDLGLALRGIGVAGSSTTLQSPFDRIGANYPSTNFVPFFENAYIKVQNLFGYPWDAVIGQQSFTLGSGLLLADDGAGFAGFSSMASLPWRDMKAGLFIFQPRNSQATANSLMVYGGTLEIPTEGVWQLNELVEKDQAPQTVSFGVPINAATRYFTSARYQISYGPLVFDGEAAIERGSAVPSPADTTTDANGVTVPYSQIYPGNIAYRGDAEVIKAKWRQPLPFKMGDGIGRIMISRGSGARQNIGTVDGAFFPSHGHRYDGLERDGMGEFFSATPYDAFGGRSTSTVSGLPAGLSGIQTVGVGFTPPAYHGVILDINYFLYQADRNHFGPSRTLGREWDIRLRYRLRDKLSFQASAGFFSIGPAIGQGNAHRLMLEAAGHF